MEPLLAQVIEEQKENVPLMPVNIDIALGVSLTETGEIIMMMTTTMKIGTITDPILSE